MELKITTLIENQAGTQDNLAFEHGLSLYIEFAGKRLLFDTGQTGAFADNARCAELPNLLGQRQREAMLSLAGGAALLCLLLVTVGMYLRRSSGSHARGSRLPSFRKEESEKS